MQKQAEPNTLIFSVFDSALPSVGNTENTANIKALFFHEFHNQSTPVKILKSYLASNEMAKPPPRASLIFKTSPFFTVL